MTRFTGLVAVTLVVVASGACGGGNTQVETSDDTGTGTPATARPEDGSGSTLDCGAFPEDLVRQAAMGYTAVRQLDPARNLETLEEFGGLPDPSVFRAFADLFEQLDTSGIEAMQFDTPDTTAVGQRQLADLLEAALSVRDDPAHAAWSAFRAFADENLTRQQLSMNYYMNEAGCV